MAKNQVQNGIPLTDKSVGQNGIKKLDEILESIEDFPIENYIEERSIDSYKEELQSIKDVSQFYGNYNLTEPIKGYSLALKATVDSNLDVLFEYLKELLIQSEKEIENYALNELHNNLKSEYGKKIEKNITEQKEKVQKVIVSKDREQKMLKDHYEKIIKEKDEKYHKEVQALKRSMIAENEKIVLSLSKQIEILENQLDQERLNSTELRKEIR